MSFLYYPSLFLFIISKYIDLISFVGAPVYYAVIVERYINTAVLLLVFTQMCLAAGGLLGREVLKDASRKRTVKIILLAVLTLAQMYWLLEKVWNYKAEPFYLIMALYLIAFSKDRSFQAIMKTFLLAYSVLFLTAALGQILGYTRDAMRITDYGTKHAFGFVHPNTAAHVIQADLFAGWFLYLRGRRRETLLLFWISALVLILWNRCRTVIITLVLFPVVFAAVDRWGGQKGKLRKYILSASPLLCLCLTLLLCIPIDLIHRFTYDTPLFSIGERFVQSGIALRTYGLPFIGHSIDTSRAIKMLVDGVQIPLFVMDNAYISYGIILGLLWLIPCLCYLSLANLRAWNGKNRALLLYGVFMAVFAILERRGLDPAFNMMFFYPLSVYKKRGARCRTSQK